MIKNSASLCKNVSSEIQVLQMSSLAHFNFKAN